MSRKHERDDADDEASAKMEDEEVEAHEQWYRDNGQRFALLLKRAWKEIIDTAAGPILVGRGIVNGKSVLGALEEAVDEIAEHEES